MCGTIFFPRRCSRNGTLQATRIKSQTGRRRAHSDKTANYNDTLQRLNNKAVEDIVEKYLTTEGKQAQDLTAADLRAIKDEINAATGSIADFNTRIGSTNPGVRTVEDAIEHAIQVVGESLAEQFVEENDARGFREGVAPVKLGGKWGFIYPNRRFAIPNKFDFAAVFSEGVARIKVGELWGYIDHTGEYVIEPKYRTAWDFSEGLAPAEQISLWGFISRRGDFELPPVYRKAARFSGGLARVETNDRTGFIDRSGVSRIKQQFRRAGDFRSGLALIENTKEIGYIDSEGNFVWQGPYVQVSFAYM